MGLAGPRKRTKISHDPNNTSWSRSTTGYGHKIMSAQGWTPGSLLGARNASHSEHFTPGSSSHIRVILKDDNLGLGARPKGRLAEDEPTGLDAFQGLLGRLNGKSNAELEKEQQKRDDRKLAIYAQRRWKSMNFVSGGLLVQEKMKTLKDAGSKNLGDQHEAPSTASKEKSKKKRKKEKSKRTEEGDTADEKSSSSTSKRPKGDTSTDGDVGTTTGDEFSIGKKHKKSKARKRKETEADDSTRNVSDDEKDGVSTTPTVELPVGNGTLPATSRPLVTAKERRPLGRHVIRGRHIQHKKMALMDDKSLNEIFMIKS